MTLLTDVPSSTAPDGHYQHHRDLATSAIDHESRIATLEGASSTPPATVTLSSADILDLHNTPVTLVAAPGAGKWLNVHRIASYYKYGTAAYTTSGATTPYVGYAVGPQWAVVDIVSDTVDIIKTQPGDLAGSVATDAINSALLAFTDGAVFTDGDGTLTITVWYSIEDVPA